MPILVHGRVYVLKKPKRTLQTLAVAGYVSLFDDALYTVLARPTTKVRTQRP